MKTGKCSVCKKTVPVAVLVKKMCPLCKREYDEVMVRTFLKHVKEEIQQ